MFRLPLAAALAALLLLAGPGIAGEPLDVKILYCGEPGSPRASDYCAFLESHFRQVTVQNLLTFQEEQASSCDVVIIDWSDVFNGQGGFDLKKMQAMKAPPLSAAFARPTILIGSAGGDVVKALKLKIDWLCLCLAGPAHSVAADHSLFHTPLEVSPEFTEQDTPVDYAEETVGDPLGPKMKVWALQTKNYPQIDPGLVSDLYGFADSPDAEVFARGIASKGPDTVALGRHANYFLWGFSAPPSDMTPAGQRLFVNAVCYMRQFDGQKPLVHRVARAREWALRYALIPRLLTEERQKRTEKEMRDLFQKSPDIIPAEFRDNPEAFITKRIEKHLAAERSSLEMVIPKPLFEQFGNDPDKLLAYYRENFEFLRAGEKDQSMMLLVDEDAKAVGPSNRSPELLERCVTMIERNGQSELATRLLKRYTNQDFAAAAQWRAWLDENQPRLFFSDSGGYKFFVAPKSP